uniref:DUF1178 domain-containing protein n=1 Tax=uncultured marine bacterium 440 TaxID=257390 RepID=Q6SHD5_9BACT|nr:conserved hypothetical protein [uncultured marine bacterium 440]
MIKYNLTCKCGESFESWFLSSSGFDYLCRKKLIKCIYCGSLSIKKSVMAPNLPSKSNKVFKKTKLEKNIKKQLLDFRKYIEKNCKDVGENFTREARSIHYDKKTSQGIYGKATPEETSELLEEGIEIATIPWIDKSEN